MATETHTLGLLKDHHSHPLLYASFMEGCDLSDVHEIGAATRNLNEASERSTGNVTLGYGWRDNRFPITSETLKDLGPTVVFNLSLHWLVTNDSAREILRSRYGDDVDRVNDPNWYEQNFRTVLNWFAKLNGNAESLTKFYDSVLQQGVAYCEELALVDGLEIDMFAQAGLLQRTRFWATPDVYASLSPQHQSAVYGLKLFTDGALGSRTAGLHRPFIENEKATKNTGMLIYSDRVLESTIDSCLATGKALAIHAIGDRAIDQTIERLKHFRDRVGQAPEVRMEHAQMISGMSATVAKELGIALCMQPNFNQDSVDYTDRLDVGYCRVNNPFRMLIDHIGFVPGEDLIFGSDGMPHGIDNAIEQSIFPSQKNQQLTVKEFELGYCFPHESSGEGIPDGEIRLDIDRARKRVKIEVVLK